ncbi:putative lipoprotein [Enhygromyxa salina]|uniref:Putative lipoprotein n=1 Tax=Enhygromyxa salina TaxID=215803 RepID=A0A0C1ZPA4_9BACT|nr:putative lipoprotein [Enhygromyxa salina]
MLAGLLGSLGCSDLGTHELAIEGNEAITQSIEASATDGWTITFTSFVVVVHDPGLIERTDNKPTWVRVNGVTVWELVSDLAEGEALSRQIRATNYDGADFRIAPASASSYDAATGNATTEQVEAAVDGGWSIHVIGSASDNTRSVDFDWTFDTNTRYRCKFEGDDVVELTADGTETSVIEIMGDVLFRTAVETPEAPLVFQPVYDADVNADGQVTNEELEAAGLMDTMVELTRELGGVRGAGACAGFEGGAND